MMRGNLQWGAWSHPITPVYLKAIKDIFLILALFIATIKIFLDKRLLRFLIFDPFFSLINILLVSLILLSLVSLAIFPHELVFVGFRAYWTLLLVYVGACFFRFDEKSFIKAFSFVFVLHLSLQVIQFYLGSGYTVFAENRNPGVFIVPTTAGAFAILGYYLFSLGENLRLKALTLVSLALSASTIAALIMVSYFIYSIFYRFKRHIELYPFLLLSSAGALFLILTNLDVVSGRGDGAYQSLFTRLGYISSVLSEIDQLPFGRGMGIATSQAVMTGMEGAIVADNTFTGAILNLGWVVTIALLILVLSSYFVFENKLLFFAFFGFSMVANMFEMSPVVQILMILLGQHAARRKLSPRCMYESGHLIRQGST